MHIKQIVNKATIAALLWRLKTSRTAAMEILFPTLLYASGS